MSLYVVSTPIGNLKDITLRAVDILQKVSVIAAEDTRHSGVLLKHLNIATPMISLHEHNEAARCQQLIERLKQGEDIALIADAGTPLISDPGYRLLVAAHNHSIKVVPVPGASATLAALVVAGLPTDRFVFEGFLPAKGQVRQARVQAVSQQDCTVILFESVHRIVGLIDLLLEACGAQRIAVIARELTKAYETIVRAPLGELQQYLQSHPEQLKGEYVVVLQGQPSPELSQVPGYEPVLQVLLETLSVSQAVKIAVKLTGVKRKVLYEAALKMGRL